ncbi:alpha/beta fold hydrolase [Rhodobacterales bacterium HKCCE3408]|nr:alpha/beta fold hydrolase [Rhodobacterales bacterium HKCCE3408]
MRPVLLIHGSGHGAWCWRDVLPALAARGVPARAIDLPGLGEDRTPAAEVTLETTAAAITRELDAPTLLVGHSLGGIAITAAAEARPEMVAGLVYLCAWMPESGDSAGDLRRRAGCADLVAAMEISPDGQTLTYAADKVPDLFYHDCPDEAVAYAMARLRPQPTAPSTTAVTRSERSRDIPRDYIVCTQDHAIVPQAQEEAAARLPATHRHRLDSSHSPFFACPDKLADMLTRIADRP